MKNNLIAIILEKALCKIESLLNIIRLALGHKMTIRNYWFTSLKIIIFKIYMLKRYFERDSFSFSYILIMKVKFHIIGILDSIFNSISIAL